MRYRLWIGLLLSAVVLTACNSRKSQEIAAAMAQAEAVYGDGNLLVETDTALFIPGLAEASQYYAGKKQYGKAALAALYNGYTERDFDKEAAMVSFKDAERYGELAHDSLTVARAEYWMGKLLYDEYNHQEALDLLRQSDECFSDLYEERALATNLLACCYIHISDFDSALFCFNRSIEYADLSHSSLAKVKALNNLAVLYQLVNDYDKAIETLRMVNVENQGQRTLNQLNLANAFFYMGLEDSAGYYYQKVEVAASGSGDKMETLCVAYTKLAKWYEHRGDLSSALDYRKKYESCLDEIRDEREQKRLFRIQKQYDYEALQNTMNQKIIRTHRVIFLFSVLLLVFAAAIIVLQYRNKQMLEAEKEMKRQLDSMKEHLHQNNKHSALDNLVVSQLKMIIVANRTTNRIKDPQNGWRPLLLEVMGKKEKPFEAALKVIEQAYPDLYSVILENHPDLSETEAKVCMLSCFDLSNQEIAELLELKTNTINQNRSTLRRKLDLKSEKMSEQLRIHFSK